MGCGESTPKDERGGASHRNSGTSYSKDLIQAISNGDATKLRNILKASPKGIEYRDEKGETLLHYASYKDPDDSAQCMEALLNVPGIDMNAINTDGWTAMHYCADAGRCKAMRVLLMSSAKHDIRDKAGMMPIHLLARKGYAACIEAMVTVDAPTDQVDSAGRTALHIVCSSGYEDCLRPLLTKKPALALTMCDNAGRTPLHYAAEHGHLLIVEALLEAGADKKCKDGAGLTAGRLANACGHVKCAVALGAAPSEEAVEKLKATNLKSNEVSNSVSSAPEEPKEGLSPAGSDMYSKVQALMDSTWKDATTRDRDFKSVPHFEVVQVLRNINSAKWKKYCERRDQLALHYVKELNDVKTVSKEWDSEQGEARRKEVNEFFLFHGTTPQGAQNISEEDFRLDLSGSHKGSLYGPGLYFAESSSKADEYAQDDDEGLYRGLYAMLICRVSLGNPSICTDVTPDVSQITKDIETDTHHSILGDREAAKGTFREFVVRDSAQAFPAYAVIYRRAYR